MREQGALIDNQGQLLTLGVYELATYKEEAITFWPDSEQSVPDTKRLDGLSVQLKDGSEVAVSTNFLTFKLTGPDGKPLIVLRLRPINELQEA